MRDSFNLAIVRTCPSILSVEFYNIQELGLAKSLLDHKVNTDIFMAGSGKNIETQVVVQKGACQVRLIRLPFILLPLIGQALYPGLIRHLKKNSYDLIQTAEENELTSFILSIYGKIKKIPVIINQGMYEPISGRFRTIYQKFYDIVVLPALISNIVLAITKTTKAKQYLENKGFIKTQLLPVGLDEDKLIGGIEENWRITLGVDKTTFILLYVGVIEKRRNVDFIVEITHHLLERGMDVFTLIVGEGPERSKCERLAEDLCMGDRIKFLGRVKQVEIPSIYESADLFLLPSNYEIYGMVVLESMFFGVPVISTATAGPLDIIDHNVDGIIVAEIDMDVWTSKVMFLLNPKSLEFLSYNAKTKIEGELTWNRIAERYKKEVLDVIFIQ